MSDRYGHPVLVGSVVEIQGSVATVVATDGTAAHVLFSLSKSPQPFPSESLTVLDPSKLDQGVRRALSWATADYHRTTLELRKVS